MDVGSAAALGFFMAFSFSAAVPGIVFRPGRWYRNLSKPSWRPPDWLFGPVWLVLYITIGVSGWLVWQRAAFSDIGVAMTLFGVQLVLNACWSMIFFGLRRPDLAFVEILLLWLSIIATIAAFFPIDQTAAYLLIPYLCWVSFAVTLNYRIWRLNSVFAS